MPITCGTSGQDFAVAEGFVHGFGNSVYSCSHCEQPFPTKSAYQDHTFLELTDRRCACAKCSEIFRWSENKGDNSSYYDHKRRHGSLDHRCPHCKMCFVSSEVLQDHLEGNMGDVPIGVLDMGCRFACSQCPQTFMSCKARCNHTHPEIQPFHQAANVVLDRCAIPRQGNNTCVVRNPYSTPLSLNKPEFKLQKRKPVTSLSLVNKSIRDTKTAVDVTISSSFTPTANGSETESHKMLSGVLTPETMSSHQVVPLDSAANSSISCNAGAPFGRSRVQLPADDVLDKEFLLLNTIPVDTTGTSPVFDYDMEMPSPFPLDFIHDDTVTSVETSLAANKKIFVKKDKLELGTEDARDVPEDNMQRASSVVNSSASFAGHVRASPNPNNTKAASGDTASLRFPFPPALNMRSTTGTPNSPLSKEETSVSGHRLPVTQDESPAASSPSYEDKIPTVVGNLFFADERKLATARAESLTTQRNASPTRSPCSIEKNATSASNLAFCCERRPVTAQVPSDSSEANSPVPHTTPTLGTSPGTETRAAVEHSPSVANKMSTSSPRFLRAHAKARLEDSKLAVLRSKLSIADKHLTHPKSKLSIVELKSWMNDIEERLKAADDWFREGDEFLLPSETFHDGSGNPTGPVVGLGKMDLACFADSDRCAEEWLFYAEKMLAFSGRAMPPGSKK